MKIVRAISEVVAYILAGPLLSACGLSATVDGNMYASAGYPLFVVSAAAVDTVVYSVWHAERVTYRNIVWTFEALSDTEHSPCESLLTGREPVSKDGKE